VSIAFKNRKVKKVAPLDHDGRLAHGAQSLPVKAMGQGSAFTIDGKQTKIMYYLVEYE